MRFVKRGATRSARIGLKAAFYRNSARVDKANGFCDFEGVDTRMAVLGKWTLSDLSGAEALFIAPQNAAAPSGGAPVFSKEAARLSLELAATAYSFDADPWADAGWTDFSFQVDNTLLTGEKVNLSGGLWRGAVREWLQYLAKSRAQRRNPISQFIGFRRQQAGDADTCKAIVMLHRMNDGRYAVAVGFMGTGKRIYDWVSNLRVKPVSGLHEGFSQLANEFYQIMPQIEFPSAAAELGLARLTLKDISHEMEKKDSRFVLWAAGHSQGGAVLQIFFDRLLRDGVQPENLCGWGFASPSVANGGREGSFLRYPITHIINGDDVTPRVGALTHLGRCCVFMPDANERAAFYRTVWDDLCFRETMALVSQTRDTAQALLFALALLRVLAALPQEDLRRAVAGLMGRLLPEKMIYLMDDKLDAGLRFSVRRLTKSYLEVTGKEALPAQELAYLENRQRDLLLRYGTLKYIHAFLSALSLPHKLTSEDDGKSCVAPYLYIVRRGFDSLRDFSLVSGSVPVWTQPRRTPPTARRRAPGSRFAGLTRLRGLHGLHGLHGRG